MQIYRSAFLLCTFTVINSQIFNGRRPVIRIAQGLVAGVKLYADSNTIIDSYLGLPYAASPVGKLRFSVPQRHEGWNGTWEASNIRPSCPQLPIKENLNESENCLFLNIWAPENAIRYPMPVVIFFDGEGFERGGRFPMSGQDLATEGIVVVTVNYRLNVFGFLCFETQDIRGNMGLLDQYFAILWVRENIQYFGGDPGKVTLYGHSAGAASVAFHMLSPRTSGYFHRAILSSGSAVSPWHITTNAKSASWEMVRILGCVTNYFPSTLRCLRSKSTHDVLKAYEEFRDSRSKNSTSMLLPVVDTFLPESNQYLPTAPEKVFPSGTYLQVPILTGITKPISHLQYDHWVKLASQGYVHLQQFMEISKIPEIMNMRRLRGKNKEQITNLIKWRYSESNNRNVRTLLEQLKRLDFESRIEAPHFLQLQLLGSSYVQPIYVYYFDDSEFLFNSTGSRVAADLLLVFGPVLLNQVVRRFTNEEFKFIKHVKQLWKNFIIFGNPTPSNHVNTWQRYNSVENYIEYLGINPSVSQEGLIDRIRRVNFWNTLLPKFSTLDNIELNTISKELQNIYVPGSGYRHAIYALSGLVVALLALLLIFTLLIKKRTKERDRQFQMVY